MGKWTMVFRKYGLINRIREYVIRENGIRIHRILLVLAWPNIFRYVQSNFQRTIVLFILPRTGISVALGL